MDAVLREDVDADVGNVFDGVVVCDEGAVLRVDDDGVVVCGVGDVLDEGVVLRDVAVDDKDVDDDIGIVLRVDEAVGCDVDDVTVEGAVLREGVGIVTDVVKDEVEGDVLRVVGDAVEDDVVDEDEDVVLRVDADAVDDRDVDEAIGVVLSNDVVADTVEVVDGDAVLCVYTLPGDDTTGVLGIFGLLLYGTVCIHELFLS